ncbi:hypothetical protein HOY80DRAFT_998055 [Tuber brumale]|nr:hypothetical protein HOY80DRAFT_998055 [Tuber brumale]
MHIPFSSLTLLPWASRPTTYHMFTHFATYRKLVSSRIKSPTRTAPVSYIEFQRQLGKLETIWYKRFMQLWEEKNKQLKEVREEKDKQLKELSEEKDKQIKEEREEREKEREQMQQRIDQHLEENIELRDQVLYEYTERMKREKKFNIRGALERIVFQAGLEKKIDSKHGIQNGLNELSIKKELVDILEKVVQERHLIYMHVDKYFPYLYSRVSTLAHSNDSVIVIRAAQFASNERAALVALLRLQSKWSYPLNWREEKEEKEQKDKE